MSEPGGGGGLNATAAPSSETVRTARTPGSVRDASSAPVVGSSVRRVVDVPSLVALYSTDQSRLGTAPASWNRTWPLRGEMAVIAVRLPRYKSSGRRRLVSIDTSRPPPHALARSANMTSATRITDGFRMTRPSWSTLRRLT